MEVLCCDVCNKTKPENKFPMHGRPFCPIGQVWELIFISLDQTKHICLKCLWEKLKQLSGSANEALC